jgi:hypothetical protein
MAMVARAASASNDALGKGPFCTANLSASCSEW